MFGAIPAYFMSPSKEEAIFALAVAKSKVDCASFLDPECNRNPALRQRVEAMLAAHDTGRGEIIPSETKSS